MEKPCYPENKHGRYIDQTTLNDSDVIISYAGCGCAGGVETTIESEVVPTNISSPTTARRKQKITEDILGRVVKTEAFNWDGTTVYTTVTNTYNGRDQVISSKQYNGGTSGEFQETTASYDGHGRVAYRHVPQQRDTNDDPTYTSYEYNADDNLSQVIDARGASTNYSYNSLGLIDEISGTVPELSGIPAAHVVSFEYDDLGNRTSMEDGLGTINYEYNSLSRMTAETRYFDDSLANAPVYNSEQAFRLEYTYTLRGQLKTYTDPYDKEIAYTQDKIGRLSSVTGDSFGGVTSYLSNPSYRAWGGTKHLEYGSGVATDVTYNNRLQADTFKLQKSGSAAIMQKNYEYYADGRLKYTEDELNGIFDRLNTYDHMGRPLAAKSGEEARGGTVTTNQDDELPYRQSYGFNAFGNLTDRDNLQWGRNVWGGRSFNLDYTYENNRITNTGWEYDADGRATKTAAPDETYRSVYNSLGQLIETRKNLALFSPAYQVSRSYDGHGRLASNHKPEQYDGSPSTPTYTTFTYNTDDTTATVTDPRGAVTTYKYGNVDDGGSSEYRALLTKVQYSVPGGSGIYDPADISYTYDSAGSRTLMSDETGTHAYSYDELSRIKTETKDFADTLTYEPSGGYVLAYTWQLTGGIKKITDPFSNEVRYTVDKIGRTTAIGDASSSTAYASDVNFRAFGALKSMSLSATDPIDVSMTHDNALRTASYQAHSDANAFDLQNADYVYNSDSTVNTLDNNAEPLLSQFNKYDFAGRLKFNNVAENSEYISFTQNMGYDQFNNLTSRSNVDWDLNTYEFSSTYANNRKASGGATDTYDVAGNVTLSDRSYPWATTVWKYDAASRQRRWEEFGPYGLNTKKGGQVSFDGDGTSVKIADLTDTKVGGFFGNWTAVNRYFIYSSVTGQKISELNEAGALLQTSVYLGSDVVASRSGSGVKFRVTDPVSGSERNTDSAGVRLGDESEVTELAGLGTSVPVSYSTSLTFSLLPRYGQGGYIGNPEDGCVGSAVEGPGKCSEMIREKAEDKKDDKKNDPPPRCNPPFTRPQRDDRGDWQCVGVGHIEVDAERPPPTWIEMNSELLKTITQRRTFNEIVKLPKCTIRIRGEGQKSPNNTARMSQGNSTLGLSKIHDSGFEFLVEIDGKLRSYSPGINIKQIGTAHNTIFDPFKNEITHGDETPDPDGTDPSRGANDTAKLQSSDPATGQVFANDSPGHPVPYRVAHQYTANFTSYIVTKDGKVGCYASWHVQISSINGRVVKAQYGLGHMIVLRHVKGNPPDEN